MLVSNRRPGSRARIRSDETGAALVAVVITMFVGFVIAATVAASVTATIRANVGNRDNLEAFIAAESGRDVAVGAMHAGCDPSAVTFSGSGPDYVSSIHHTEAGAPTSSLDPDVVPGCPGEDSNYVVISSTGTGPDGSTVTVDSVYPWAVSYSEVPGGVVTYFSGSVTQGVSHYTGDLVLRTGNWTCNIDGTMNGDLYVLDGSVTLSNNCTINGDVYADGPINGQSSGWAINARPASSSAGNVTTNATIELRSNGDTNVEGSLHAMGEILLDDNGGGLGVVGGTVTTTSTATVDPGWTTGPVTEDPASPPVFVPTLEWLEAATQWIDLDSASGWGATVTPSCSELQTEARASDLVKPMLSSGTTPLVIDFSSCTRAVSLRLESSAVTRDVAIITPRDETMSVRVGGLTADSPGQQLFFVHSDGNRDDRDPSGDTVPTCGSDGTRNTSDSFGTSSAIDPDVKIMLYSPCGLNGTVTAAFSGQLYTDDTAHFHSGSYYTCQSMSWPPALAKLGCTIKGEDGIIDETATTQTLGDLIYQTER